MVDLGENVVLQPPLSRCGKGPGLIIIRQECYAQCQDVNDSLDPEPLKKWAEESFCIVQITLPAKGKETEIETGIRELLFCGLNGLKSRPECSPNDKFGIMSMLYPSC